MASTDARVIPYKNAAYRVTFPILDADGDLVTGATSPDSEISKDGGTFADCTNEATEIATASGMYYLDLSSTEMNADTVAIVVKSGNGKTTPIVLYPQEADDIRVSTTHWNNTVVATPATAGIPDVNVKNIDNDAASASGTVTFPAATLASTTNITAGTITTATNLTTNNDKTGYGLSSAAVQAIWDALTSALTTSGSIGKRIVDYLTGDAFARIGSNGTGLTAVPWNAAWDAEVQSEVDDALVAQRLDELVNADSDIDGAQPPTVGSVFHELMSKTTGSFTFDQTTDALEALRDRGDAAWITATGFSTHSAADVWAAGARTLTAATNITSTGGTTVPQTGDSYAIVNSGTHGNAALKTLIDAIDDYIDTEVAAIKAKTDNLPSSPAAVGSAMTLTSGERDSIAAALLDLSNGIETSLTPRQALKVIAAACAGVLSGAATTTVTIKAANNSGTTRITATVDSDGNRSGVTLNV